MDYTGRYFSARDMGLIHSINAELMGDMIQMVVILYQIATGETETNMYGEAKQETGKLYYNGIEITAMRKHDDPSTKDENFGPDRDQTVVFAFREKMLKLVNVYPQVGDIVGYNDRFYEIDNVVQEQLLGDQPTKSFSIIVNTHYARVSKLNLIDRQQ